MELTAFVAGFICGMIFLIVIIGVYLVNAVKDVHFQF